MSGMCTHQIIGIVQKEDMRLKQLIDELKKIFEKMEIRAALLEEKAIEENLRRGREEIWKC